MRAIVKNVRNTLRVLQSDMEIEKSIYLCCLGIGKGSKGEKTSVLGFNRRINIQQVQSRVKEQPIQAGGRV